METPRRDNDIPEESLEMDLHSIKRAIMRRDEAVERFRAAKAQLLRSRRVEDVRRQDAPPHHG
jgi:hypothetical protein